MAVQKPTLEFLRKQSLVHLQNEAGTPGKFQGSVIQSILEGFNQNLISVCNYTESSQDIAYSRATGVTLTNYAANEGLTRSEAEYAVDNTLKNVYVEISSTYGYTAASVIAEITTTGSSVLSTPDGIRILAGLRLTAANGATYVTTANVDFTGADTTAYLPVIATTPGEYSNVDTDGFSSHNLGEAQPDLFEIAGFITIRNHFPIDNGEELEDDPTLLFRTIHNSTAGAGGNDDSIREAALAVPGVRTVSLTTHPYGIGTTGVLIRSTQPAVSQVLIDAVQAVTDIVKARGDKIYVEAPEYKSVRIKVDLLNLPTGMTAQVKQSLYSKVRANIVNYINNIEIGRPLVFDDLGPIVKQSDPALGISTGTEYEFTNFAVSTYSSTADTIDGWVPAFNVTQTLGPLQQWITKYIWVEVCEVI